MIDSLAEVHPDAEVGTTSRVWGLAQVGAGAVVGEECVIGRAATIDGGVVLGDRVKVQAAALIYRPARLGNGVFVGPGAVLTNDPLPRAVSPDGTLKSAADWEPVGVQVEDGASIGARAVCVAPVRVGRWALVGAGSVVVHDVPDFALVVGNPARQVGWVGRTGRRLVEEVGGRLRCADTGRTYAIVDGTLREDV